MGSSFRAATERDGAECPGVFGSFLYYTFSVTSSVWWKEKEKGIQWLSEGRDRPRNCQRPNVTEGIRMIREQYIHPLPGHFEIQGLQKRQE